MMLSYQQHNGICGAAPRKRDHNDSFVASRGHVHVQGFLLFVSTTNSMLWIAEKIMWCKYETIIRN